MVFLTNGNQQFLTDKFLAWLEKLVAWKLSIHEFSMREREKLGWKSGCFEQLFDSFTKASSGSRIACQKRKWEEIE